MNCHLASARKTPTHWNRRSFDRYILQCAIRDREGFLDAHAHLYFPDLTKNTKRAIAETKAEIKAMRARLARMDQQDNETGEREDG